MASAKPLNARYLLQIAKRLLHRLLSPTKTEAPTAEVAELAEEKSGTTLEYINDYEMRETQKVLANEPITSASAHPSRSLGAAAQSA